MAFVVASHYHLQIIFLLSRVVFKGFSFFVGDDWRFCKNCFQEGLILTARWYIVTKGINGRDLLAFLYV